MHVTAGSGTSQGLSEQVKVKGKAAGITIGQRPELNRWPAVCTQAFSICHGRDTIGAMRRVEDIQHAAKVGLQAIGVGNGLHGPFTLSSLFAMQTGGAIFLKPRDRRKY